jgi:acyl-CoA synthetase (AMP-forming)/AMP-acid ligase II
MMKYTTLTDMLESNRDVDRAVTYVEGENAERRVSFAEVHARALGILHHLQAKGAQRGDKLIIFLSNNEQFLDAFWAAIAGGIVPVPLAVGISDEHRHKLLRVARKIGRPLLYTDAKNLERLQVLATEVGETELMAELKSRTFLVESISDISRQAKIHRRYRLHSVLLRLDQ